MEKNTWPIYAPQAAEPLGNQLVRDEIARVGMKHVSFGGNGKWFTLPDRRRGQLVGNYVSRKNAIIYMIAVPNAEAATEVICEDRRKLIEESQRKENL